MFLELGRKGVHGHELERFRELGITDIDDVVAYTQSHLWSGEIESYPEAGYQDCEEILELDAAGISGVLAEHLAEEGIAGTAACKQALSDTALNNVNLRRGSATSIGWVRRVVLDYSPELGVPLIDVHTAPLSTFSSLIDDAEHHADAATSLCDLLNGLDDKALKTVVKLIEEGANVSANDA